MQAATQAATARAFTGLRLLLRQRRRGGRRIGRLDVMPTERLLVMEVDGGVAGLRTCPCTGGFHEQGPVRHVLRQALGVPRRLVVDLTYTFAKAVRLRLVLDAGLIHQRLAVDGVAGEAHALLERRSGEVLDHDICMVWGARVHTAAGKACRRRAGRRSTRGDDESQCRAGPDKVLTHASTSGRSTFPERAAQSRPPGSFRAVARGRVADVGVQVSWLADRRPRPPSRGRSTSVALSDGGSPLTVARQLRL